LTTKNFAVADSEIGRKTASLPIQKSAAKNFATVDSEIDNQLGHYRFRNQQLKTVSL
jgi:hypothetical protein